MNTVGTHQQKRELSQDIPSVGRNIKADPWSGLGPVENKVLASAFMKIYTGNPCFDNINSYFVEDDPFCRPIRTQDLDTLGLFDPLPVLSEDAFGSPKALLAQRVLATIYEQDLMFLPTKNMDWNKFLEFYSNDHRKLGEFVRPSLETMLFGFLRDKI